MTAAQRARFERRMMVLMGCGARVDRAAGQRTAKDEELCRVVAILTRGRAKAATTTTATRKPVAARAKTPPPAPHNSWPAGYRVWPPSGQRAAIDAVTYRD